VRQSRWTVAVGSAVATATLVLLPSVTSGAVPIGPPALSWTQPYQVDSHPLTSVSCPTSRFCMATDNGGGVVGYTGKTWQPPKPISEGTPLTGISCPDTSFCLAFNARGEVFILDGDRWSSATPIFTAETGGDWPTVVSCASENFCMAADDYGQAAVFHGIQGGIPAWGPVVTIGQNENLTSVSCPGSGFCMVGGTLGAAYSYQSGRWRTTYLVRHAVDDPITVSCSSESFCVAIDSYGAVFAFNGHSWGKAYTPKGVLNDPALVSCPIQGGCVMAGLHVVQMRVHGKILNAPMGLYAGSFSFQTDRPPLLLHSSPVELNTELSGLDCPTPSFCVMFGYSGSVLVGYS
jgi:hypothetical protein